MNVRKSLLSSVSLLAINTMVVATAVFYPTLAQAQCSTITSDATINDAATNCVVWNGGEISITNNGTIAAGIGFSINGGTVGNLINSGVVYGAGHALYNAGTIPTISNLAGGIISGNSGPYVVGIDNEGSIGTILNSGSILTKNYLNYDVINKALRGF